MLTARLGQVENALVWIENDKVSYSYIYNNVPIVKTRLLQAGIRLAGLLNTLFDSSAKPLDKALKMPSNIN